MSDNKGPAAKRVKTTSTHAESVSSNDGQVVGSALGAGTTADQVEWDKERRRLIGMSESLVRELAQVRVERDKEADGKAQAEAKAHEALARLAETAASLQAANKKNDALREKVKSLEDEKSQRGRSYEDDPKKYKAARKLFDIRIPKSIDREVVWPTTSHLVRDCWCDYYRGLEDVLNGWKGTVFAWREGDRIRIRLAASHMCNVLSRVPHMPTLHQDNTVRRICPSGIVIIWGFQREYGPPLDVKEPVFLKRKQADGQWEHGFKLASSSDGDWTVRRLKSWILEENDPVEREKRNASIEFVAVDNPQGYYQKAIVDPSELAKFFGPDGIPMRSTEVCSESDNDRRITDEP